MKIDFIENNLSNIFKNVIHKKSTAIGYDFAWDITQQGKYIGELFYSRDEAEWWFIKDNFPHQRKCYRISFPIKDESFFIELFSKIGVEIVK